MNIHYGVGLFFFLTSWENNAKILGQVSSLVHYHLLLVLFVMVPYKRMTNALEKHMVTFFSLKKSRGNQLQLSTPSVEYRHQLSSSKTWPSFFWEKKNWRNIVLHNVFFIAKETGAHHNLTWLYVLLCFESALFASMHWPNSWGHHESSEDANRKLSSFKVCKDKWCLQHEERTSWNT